MTRVELLLPLPFLYPSQSKKAAAIACTLFEDADKTALFVEAPNWATSYKWGPAAALAAWNYWRDSDQRLNPWNPSDLAHFHVYAVRPGFPLGPEPLWQEPFTYYDAIQRSATLVRRLIPVPGTATMQEGGPLSLARALAEVGLAPQELQQFDEAGELKRSS